MSGGSAREDPREESPPIHSFSSRRQAMLEARRCAGEELMLVHATEETGLAYASGGERVSCSRQGVSGLDGGTRATVLNDGAAACH